MFVNATFVNTQMLPLPTRRRLRYIAGMPALPSTIWLSREERRALARDRRQPTTTAATTTRSCLFCLGPLTNGRAVCSDQCDEAFWRVVPTRDGEIYEPS
jgi:hypothetical protein